MTVLRKNSTGNEVKTLQKALEDKGYSVGKHGIDGIFGDDTYRAVLAYQKDNGLAQDGIAGEKTLGLLYAAPQTETAKETPVPDLPDYGTGALLAELNGRPAFSYDPEEDPLYAQYRKRYIRQGRQAMEDTMGKAAALTGGYGNSYAETAAQQAYGKYLDELNDSLPELYALARESYDRETDDLLSRYKLAQTQYENAVKDRKTRREDLTKLLAAGYTPTDEELSAAGMTRTQANALLAAAESKKTASKSGSGTKTATAGKIPDWLRRELEEGSYSDYELKKKLSTWSSQPYSYLTQQQAQQLYDIYSPLAQEEADKRFSNPVYLTRV